MPNGVYATMDRVEGAAAKPHIDFSSADPTFAQLPACHHSVLSLGKLGDQGVRWHARNLTPSVFDID